MWVKRVVVCILSLALLVGAIALSYEVPAVMVRQGREEGAQIRTVEDLHDVLQSVEALDADQSITSLALDAESDGYRYSSVIMTKTTNMTLDNTYSLSYGGYMRIISSNKSLRRKLQIAFAQNAVYYVSEGQLLSRERSSQRYSTEQEERYYLDYSVNAYVCSAYVLLKINQLEYGVYRYDSSLENGEKENWGDDTLNDLQGYLGVWIDCTPAPEIAEIFLSANENVIPTVGLISDFLEDALNRDENIFYYDSGHYTLDADGLKQLFGISASEADDLVNFDGMFEINLSSAESPAIELDLTSSVVNSSAPDAAVSERYGTDINLWEALLFENIDNTVIEFSRSVDAVDILEIVGEGN